MAAPLILARTFKQAHEFARERLDLKVGHYRVNPSASTIRAVRNTQIYLVPGWKQRSDRFGVQGALRYCRLEVIDVETWEQAPADPRGDLTERQLEIAYRYNALLDLPAAKAESTLSEEEIAEIEKHLEPVGWEPTDNLLETLASSTAEPIDEPYLNDEGSITTPVTEPEQTSNALETKDAPAEAPKRRRRSKCKSCGQLHYKDEPCPTPDEG